MGVLRGVVPGLIVYSYIIAAVGDDDLLSGSNNNEYRRSIEFQCTEFLNIVSYIGIHFYSCIRDGPCAEINFIEIKLVVIMTINKIVPSNNRRQHSICNKSQILSGKCRLNVAL